MGAHTQHASPSSPDSTLPKAADPTQASPPQQPSPKRHVASNIQAFISSRFMRTSAPQSHPTNDSASSQRSPTPQPTGHEAPSTSPAHFPLASSSTIATLAERASATYIEAPGLQIPPNHAHNHPTLKLIEQRLKNGCAPGQRSDGFKLGLVVEGGGMRGIVSGAMLMAINNLNLRGTFDAVYGASAGAINATYFLTGQGYGLDVYMEDLTGSEFLNFSNFLNGKPVMNLDYLIDNVITHRKPLDFEGVIKSTLPLKIVASSLDTLQPVMLDNFSSRADLIDCLKASANVPELAGPPRIVRGQRLVDAAVFEPVPLQTALRDGCTHVLVLCTRPPSPTSPWRRRVKQTLTSAVKQAMMNPPYMRDAWRAEQHTVKADEEEWLVAAINSCPHSMAPLWGGSFVLPCYPAHTGGCHPVCKDVAALQRGKEQGLAAVGTLFSHMSLPGGLSAFGADTALAGRLLQTAAR
ncbi:MAG: hypothetical protein WDW38_001088 [Sanguina aurantia]